MKNKKYSLLDLKLVNGIKHRIKKEFSQQLDLEKLFCNNINIMKSRNIHIRFHIEQADKQKHFIQDELAENINDLCNQFIYICRKYPTVSDAKKLEIISLYITGDENLTSLEKKFRYDVCDFFYVSLMKMFGCVDASIAKMIKHELQEMIKNTKIGSQADPEKLQDRILHFDNLVNLYGILEQRKDYLSNIKQEDGRL